MNNNISWLTSVPASDVNFKAALKRATRQEIEEALNIVRGAGLPAKTKTAALERALRRKDEKV